MIILLVYLMITHIITIMITIIMCISIIIKLMIIIVIIIIDIIICIGALPAADRRLHQPRLPRRQAREEEAITFNNKTSLGSSKILGSFRG